LSIEERVEEGLKEGLHGLNTVGGRLPTKSRVQANHRAEEGDCAKNERDVVRIGQSSTVLGAGESAAQRRDDLGRERVSPRAGERALSRSKKTDACSRGPTTATSSM
jgi:hypothetical protein